MKRYRLLNIRKWYVPDFVIFFKGKVHARKGLITTDDGIVKSPYLLECRYIFMEYNKKLDSMEELGYKTVKVKGVDLFGRTGHVETVCLLSKKDK